MIHVLGKIPQRCFVATSGGVDSMAVLDFLSRGRKQPVVVHYNHGTSHGQEAETFVRDYCSRKSIPLITSTNTETRPAGTSPEAWWRSCRYKFFHRLEGPVITCHQLNDQIENWIFTSLRGNSRLIPYRNQNVIRPFLMTRREVFEDWNRINNVPYLVDPSNSNNRYTRSFIRHNMVEQALVVNPGLYKTISKKVKAQYNEM